jgi:integrase
MLTKTHLVRIADKQTWSAEHRRSLKTSMISFFEWAMAEEIVDHNPALCLPKVKSPMPHPRPAPDRIWDELLTAAKPRERLMAQLAAGAGLRRGEIAQLHIDDLVEDHDGWSLFVRGKGSKQRVVPITDRLAAEIRRQHQFGYLFPGLTNGHLSPQRVGEVLSRLMPEGWSAHSLRHRYATRGYAGTHDLRAVQEALGHASVRTTQIYTAVSKRDVRLVSEAAAPAAGRGGAYYAD